MRLFSKSGRTKSTHHSFFPESSQHPDLPLSPKPAPLPRTQHNLNRSTSVSERFSAGYAGDRRSIAVFSGTEQGLGVSAPTPPETSTSPTPPQQLSGGLLGRSQTVLRKDGGGRTTSPPSPVWSPDFAQFPSAHEQHDNYSEAAPMTSAQNPIAPGKTSSDSQQQPGLDRFSQRRLQRLNTEAVFREQRQGGTSVASPPPVVEQSVYNNKVGSPPYPAQQQSQPPPPLQQQPHPPQSAYQSARTAQPVHPNTGFATQTQPVSNASRSPNFPQTDASQAYAQSQEYSPPTQVSQYQSQETSRPSYAYRGFSHPAADETQMSANNGGLPAPKPTRTGAGNRQSVHNGLGTPGGTSAQQQGVSAFNASVVPPEGQGATRSQQQSDVDRVTPQPAALGEDMSEDEVNQLIKDHKELREKYTKVKKYYFEKEDQVKQLQNSLAHQRLSQSRTSLDDSEYSTRFNRLDGLIAQLAFSIRKSWRSTPDWLDKSVNKDAVSIGKQEMTAAGRAVISHWLVQEVFNRYFHPDLEPALSAQLKTVQLNIRRFAPAAQTVEEEDYLTSKVINWRLATLEGLQDALRSPSCPANRAQLTDILKERLIRSLATHLQDPPPSDLEGGVHMIVELVVSILIHLPVESRDVVIEYFPPGYSIMQDQMKFESGIPPLTTSIADDQAERASMKSAASDITDNTDGGMAHGETQPKKRSMLSALTGTGKSKAASAQAKHAGAGGSQNSLHRPESSQGQQKADAPPQVRMAAGIGVHIRGRTVLVKAPVFST